MPWGPIQSCEFSAKAVDMNAMKFQGMDVKSSKASKIQDGLPKPKIHLVLMSFIFCVTTPMTVLFYCIAYQDFDTALSATAKSAYSEGFLHFFLKRTPLPTFEATRGYAAWLTFQGLLYIALPGPTVFGPPTPAGRRLRYKLNGLAAWIVTVCLAVSGSFAGILSPTALAKTWRELVAVTNIFSFIILLLFQIKARVAPDNAYETYITGSFWYDLFEGGELHPRVGQYWDWRHFLSTRSGGIIAWTLIDLSFAAYQYEQHGYLTGTMFTVVLLRAVVVVDFFVNEEVFFHTLDGKYESFGFYNIYGFSAMMPVFWTLQTQYLAKHPTEISLPALIASIVIFVAGWSLRFYADCQKMRFNRTQGKCLFWGRQAQGIPVSYQTRDGKTHRSHLLCSGLWGVARHVNYAGSVLYTWSLCSLCGNGGGFAYTEAVLVTGMIIHRCFRDEEKCADKYGSGWDEYCRRVPWRIVPGVF
ncbi:hypothetical protein ASPFODRAFT_190991 [Aspergillus luchuensis CBS 106.47]|uniref:7-dehydrocholesterol reductase n=1 Tax=Aspergillus luchuensis (strain CBS 106.47) TaxID=1137211 RepID=A0A1M3TED8_ASPLC|nr:hypothetical protein ASPFODRAFT_190991 [Aspergillus luchuensis CBS 106.47]